MSKTETTAARRKSAYICPKIVCIAVEYSLCAASPMGKGGGHQNAELDSHPLEEEEVKDLPMN
ncbi:hypothetical protein [Hoylesella timonensis]|uniref:hypothetical protein n=1 Tax=Hoylesella timonensis TaxID=386414 RepID=UPI002430F5CB|nr:hypothetical protein [Hoylesella timonensis]